VEPGRGGDEDDEGGEADETERDVRRQPIDRARPAEEKREAEDKQKVAGNRAHKRCSDDLGQAAGDGDDRNDQLRRVAEGRVQEAADPRAGVKREVVRGLTDQPREREKRCAGEHEQRQLAGSIEPIQNDDERPEKQQQCQ
jgi:hypothetical protein